MKFSRENWKFVVKHPTFNLVFCLLVVASVAVLHIAFWEINIDSLSGHLGIALLYSFGVLLCLFACFVSIKQMEGYSIFAAGLTVFTLLFRYPSWLYIFIGMLLGFNWGLSIMIKLLKVRS